MQLPIHKYQNSYEVIRTLHKTGDCHMTSHDSLNMNVRQQETIVKKLLPDATLPYKC